MKKLLSIVLILSWAMLPNFSHAEAQLLIDRLKQEGMLIPEAEGIFNNEDKQSENNSPPSPVITPDASTASVTPQQKITLSPRSGTERPSENELKQLKRKLSQAQAELQMLTKKYRALTASQPQPLPELVESFRDENKQLQQQLMAAEKQITENTRRYEKQASELSAQVEALNAKVASSKLANTQIIVEQSTLDQQRKKLADRDMEIAQLTAKLTESERQSHDLTARLNSAEESASNQSKKITQLETQTQDAAKQNAALALSVKEAAAEKITLEKQRRELADNNKANTRLETQLAEAGKLQDKVIKERDEARLKLIELEKAVTQSQDEKAQSVKRFATLQTQYNTASSELDKAKHSALSLKEDSSAEARVNYASGVYYATRMRYEMKVIENAGYKFSAKALQQGMKDKLNGTLQISEEEVGKILTTLDRKVGEINNKDSERNKQKSDQFVAQAAKAKGAEKAANGVVYQVLKKGAVPLLSPNDVIRFKLNEKISTGKVISTGEIRTGQVGRLPDLMQQGVRRIGVGGKVKMIVPWQLAYGEEGIPGTIPPGVASELTIEVTGITQ